MKNVGVVAKKDFDTGGPAWIVGTEAFLEATSAGHIVSVRIPDLGEMAVWAARAGVLGVSELDTKAIWERSGQDYGAQKEIYWKLAEMLTDALAWARETLPEAGFPELELEDWTETDFGWRAERGGVFFRLDPEDGLAVEADPFGKS